MTDLPSAPRRGTWALVALFLATATAWTAAQPASKTVTAQDLVEIQQLYAKYNWALDSGDSEGYAATFKDAVYSALVHHVRLKFLNGLSIGLAEPKDVDFAWKMLPQVKAKVGAIPGLITGVIEHGT